MPRHCALRIRAFRSTLLVLGFLAGCSGGTPLERAGVERIDIPSGWTPVATETWRVPGIALKAWNGPDGSSFVIYRELSAPGDSPASIVERVANRYLGLPALKVISAKAITFNRPAARIEATASGNGAAFLPTGTGVPLGNDAREPIPTRRVLISVPMDEETVSFLWHAPESKADELNKQIEEFRPRLRPVRPDIQSY